MHAQDKLGSTHIVEVEVFVFVASDVALLVDHLGRIFLQVVEDGAVAFLVVLVGVEHSLHLDTHYIAPLGLAAEVEQVRVGHTFHLAVGEPFAVVLVGLVFLVEYERAVDDEVVELHVACLACNLDRLFHHTVELTVLDVDVVDVLQRVAADNQHAVVALLAGDVLYIHIVHDRFETTIAYLFSLVVEVDLHYRLLALTHDDVAHIDVLHLTATAVVGLDTQDALQVWRVHHAVFGIYVLAATRDLTSYHHTAMAVFHLAVADDDVLGRLVPETTVVVATALDSDAVVAGMEHAVLDEYVLASLRVATVTVRSFVPYIHTVYRDVLGEQWMDDPERRVDHLDILDKDALAVYHVDQLRTQAIAHTELTLVERHTVLCHLQQFAA